MPANSRRRFTIDGDAIPSNPRDILIQKDTPAENFMFLDGTEVRVIEEGPETFRVESPWVIRMVFGPVGIPMWEIFWREFQRQEQITVVMGNELDFIEGQEDILVADPFDTRDFYTTFRNIISGTLLVYRSGVLVDLGAESVTQDLTDGKLTWPTPQSDNDTLTARYETEWNVKVDGLDPNDVTNFKDRKLHPMSVVLREVL